MLELEYRIGSKPIAREGLWVRIPPRVLRPPVRQTPVRTWLAIWRTARGGSHPGRRACAAPRSLRVRTPEHERELSAAHAYLPWLAGASAIGLFLTVVQAAHIARAGTGPSLVLPAAAAVDRRDGQPARGLRRPGMRRVVLAAAARAGRHPRRRGLDADEEARTASRRPARSRGERPRRARPALGHETVTDRGVAVTMHVLPDDEPRAAASTIVRKVSCCAAPPRWLQWAQGRRRRPLLALHHRQAHDLHVSRQSRLRGHLSGRYRAKSGKTRRFSAASPCAPPRAPHQQQERTNHVHPYEVRRCVRGRRRRCRPPRPRRRRCRPAMRRQRPAAQGPVLTAARGTSSGGRPTSARSRTPGRS